MFPNRCTGLFLSGAAALKVDSVPQVIRASHLPRRVRKSNNGHMTASSFPASTQRTNIMSPEPRPTQLLQHSSTLDNLGLGFQNLSRSLGSEESTILSATAKESYVRVKFSNGIVRKVSHDRLRNDCQCPKCFGHTALVESAIRSTNIQIFESGLVIQWSDGHIGWHPKEMLLDGSRSEDAVYLQDISY